MSRTFCGSLPYTAPEVLAGSLYDGRKSDMWSLGIVMYVMFNKSLPFESNNVKKLMELQEKNQPLRYRPKVMEATSELARWTVNQLLILEPSNRWSANKLIESNWINSGRGYGKFNTY